MNKPLFVANQKKKIGVLEKLGPVGMESYFDGQNHFLVTPCIITHPLRQSVQMYEVCDIKQEQSIKMHNQI